MSLMSKPIRRAKVGPLMLRTVALLPLFWLLGSACGPYGSVPPTPGTSAEVCSRGTPSPEAVAVTFDDIISDARAVAYQGRRVRLQGLLTIGSEQIYLYDEHGTCEEIRASAYGHKVGVDMSSDVSYRKICGDRLVIIEGVYRGSGAHGMDYSGLLRDVNYIVSAGPICRDPSAEGRNPPPPTIEDYTLPRSTR